MSILHHNHRMQPGNVHTSSQLQLRADLSTWPARTDLRALRGRRLLPGDAGDRGAGGHRQRPVAREIARARSGTRAMERGPGEFGGIRRGVWSRKSFVPHP